MEQSLWKLLTFESWNADVVDLSSFSETSNLKSKGFFSKTSVQVDQRFKRGETIVNLFVFLLLVEGVAVDGFEKLKSLVLSSLESALTQFSS